MGKKKPVVARAWASEELQLSSRALREKFSSQYHLWAGVGTLATVFGYLISCITIAAEYSFEELAHRLDPLALLISLLALFLHTRRKSYAAAVIVIAVVSIEVHASLVFVGAENWPAAALVVPTLNFAAALFLGLRVGLAMGGLLLFSVPLALVLSGTFGATQGLATPGAVMFVGMIGAILPTTNGLLIVYLRTLGQVLSQSLTNERRAKDIVFLSPDAMVTLTPEGLLDDLNPAAERAMQISAADARGRPFSALNLKPRSAEQPNTLERLFTSTEPVELTVGDTAVALEALARPVAQPNGKSGTLVVLRDISRRLQAERHTLELQAQLQAAQKLEAVGLLAGGVAHDFNNLLTAVGGYGSLLAASSDPEAREYSSLVLEVQQQGATLVQKLLRLARQEPEKPRSVDIGSTVAQLAPLLRRLLGERHRLVLELDDACRTQIDPGRLEQLLLNLAANARDAMTTDGVLRIECHSEGEELRLEIADTGCGMAPEIKARVFEPFFTTKKNGEGTGLGLSNARSIINEANGTVEVNSVLGEGTRFVIHLPTSDDREAVSTRPAKPLSGICRKESRAFVAEDNKWVRDYVRRLLEREGFFVETAASGSDALTALEAQATPPDLLLADVIMPGLSGPELVTELQKRWPDLRYLYMSGYLGEEAEHAELQNSPSLIDKPFTDQELLQRIEWRLSGNTDPTEASLQSLAKA